MCMALNAAGRPVPMFDPFLGGAPGEEETLTPMGAVERLLFGEREHSSTLAVAARQANNAR
ncbi:MULTISPECIES: hypothetical protein [unclassified Ensifer]|nr:MULTISPECIES: hypothetical protein [unclassified Ensifer]OCO99502.1 hypothetical protein BC362_26900 [Ensifer sp. LC14]OCP10186.1 hypothetical protein BC374_18235 [Ensifer sp. LC13]OCP33143.1 hypothetical protein BC364_17335 [Ensifer sp. LC499]